MPMSITIYTVAHSKREENTLVVSTDKLFCRYFCRQNIPSITSNFGLCCVHFFPILFGQLTPKFWRLQICKERLRNCSSKKFHHQECTNSPQGIGNWFGNHEILRMLLLSLTIIIFSLVFNI